MLLFTSAIQLAIMLGVPLVLLVVLKKRYGVQKPFWFGCIAFIGSQVVHLPLNGVLHLLLTKTGLPEPPRYLMLPINVVILGFTAGLCEEWSRYLVLRLWLKNVRSWRRAVVFGVGHGGVESFILGVIVSATVANMAIFEFIDPAAMGVPPDQLGEVTRQIGEWWATPAYMPILAALERLMAIVFHVAMATLVTFAVVRKRASLVWVAVTCHMIFNAVSVFVGEKLGGLAGEGATLVLTAGAVLILRRTRRALPLDEPSA